METNIIEGNKLIAEFMQVQKNSVSIGMYNIPEHSFYALIPYN